MVGQYKVGSGQTKKQCVVQNLDRSTPDSQGSDIYRGYKRLLNIQHPTLARYLGFVQTDVCSGIVSEMIYGVTLRDDIDENVKAKVYLAESIVLNRLWQMLQAINWLSSSKMSHGFLSPSSIFLVKDNEIKMCNFGVTRGSGGSCRKV